MEEINLQIEFVWKVHHNISIFSKRQELVNTKILQWKYVKP